MDGSSKRGMSRREFLRQVAAGAAAAAAAGSGVGRDAEASPAQAGPAATRAASAAPLPEGVRPVWDLGKAYRETTPTRARICINGLWRWQPAGDDADRVPSGDWGYFKVPGCWPGITDYMQKDCQTVHAHPTWRDGDLRQITAAWYQREITIPKEWAGRRIALHAEYLNSYAVVYIDGAKAAELPFPWGEADLTSVCRAGSTHVLTILVLALPLKGVMLAFNDTASAREVEGWVARRGLCGDVSLVGSPEGARIGDVKVDTSVRNWQIAVEAGLQDLAPDAQYALHAEITDEGRRVREFTSAPFRAGDLNAGRIEFMIHSTIPARRERKRGGVCLNRAKTHKCLDEVSWVRE